MGNRNNLTAIPKCAPLAFFGMN